MTAVRPGIVRLLAEERWRVRGQRLGLLTNQTGVLPDLRSTARVLAAASDLRLEALLTPEHGLWGAAQAGEPVPTQTDPATGRPVYSLYGPARSPLPAILQGLDAVLVDLQDGGVRFLTYFSTVVEVLEAAAVAGCRVLILDRPNPLGGRLCGNVLEPPHRSFVGAHPIAWCHGLTLGELARLVVAERRLAVDLTVVPLQGWRRELWYDETGLPWINLSPNLPTLETLIVYPGTCLLEGTNLSEGRGTTLPFLQVGAPWLDPFALADTLNGQGLPGVRFRPVYFVPTFSKHAGQVCGGVYVHVSDRQRVDPVLTGLAVLWAVRAQAPDRFAWRESPPGQYPIDRLAGTEAVRRALELGEPPAALVERWRADLRAFWERCRPVLLY